MPGGSDSITVDRDHFDDLVTCIPDDLVGTGSDNVSVRVLQKDRCALTCSEDGGTRRFMITSGCV